MGSWVAAYWGTCLDQLADLHGNVDRRSMVRLQRKKGMGMADKQSNKVETVMKWLLVYLPL